FRTSKPCPSMNAVAQNGGCVERNTRSLRRFSGEGAFLNSDINDSVEWNCCLSCSFIRFLVKHTIDRTQNKQRNSPFAEISPIVVLIVASPLEKVDAKLLFSVLPFQSPPVELKQQLQKMKKRRE